MSEADARWLAIGIGAVAGLVVVAFMGHKLNWAVDVRRGERARFYAVMAVTEAVVGWLYSWVAMGIAAIVLGALLIPLAGLIAGPVALIFAVGVPLGVLLRVYLWVWEPFYWRTVSPRMESRVRAEAGLPPKPRESR